jgi:muramoyltetrapeptide carboxypeptidase
VVAFRAPSADEPIGVVALSGPVEQAALARGLEVLKSFGFPVVLASNLEQRVGYLAGSDEARLKGLIGVLDQGARVLIAARGGYGSGRLLKRLPWERLSRDCICFVGYSDITAVMNALVGRAGGTQVHGPMVAAGLEDGRNATRLAAVLRGDLIGARLLSFGPSQVLRPGRCVGRAMGGNLSMLCTLVGTPFAPSYEGSVVFLEDVGEALYRLDRMLTQLACSGTFRGVKALISGSLHRCSGTGPRSSSWRNLLLRVAPPDAAVIVGLPFGHGKTNIAFPIGASVEVDTDSGSVTWRE